MCASVLWVRKKTFALVIGKYGKLKNFLLEDQKFCKKDNMKLSETHVMSMKNLS